jgi:ketosteroid isomerase-like protein
MKLSIVLLALLSTAAFGAAEPDEATVETMLRHQATAWDAALWNKDEKAIVANIGEGFRHVDGHGEISDKARFVADLLDTDLRIDPYTVENFEVVILGDTALLTGETHMTGAYQQKPFQSHYRYVDVYQRREGRWTVVYIQITKLP